MHRSRRFPLGATALYPPRSVDFARTRAIHAAHTANVDTDLPEDESRVLYDGDLSPR